MNGNESVLLLIVFVGNQHRRLLLSDNIISDIGRGTFAAINRIGTIDLARNQIKKLDYQMFAQLNYIEVCAHARHYYFCNEIYFILCSFPEFNRSLI